ncbi:MAG: alpha/beta fold hydrolase [Gammaproteobacteria bacterium]
MAWYVVVAVVAAAVLAIAVGLQWVAGGRERRQPPPATLLGPVGARWHVRLKGQGLGPTVVVEQGAGGVGPLWWAVQDAVAEFAPVLTYDRLGLGWSDAASPTRSVEQRVEELRELLDLVQTPKPYVLVAHSYGGLIVRQFARKYRDRTAALVLVDSLEEAAILRADVLKIYARFGVILSIVACVQSLGLPRLWSKLFRGGGETDARSVALAQLSLRPAMYRGMRDDFRTLPRLPEAQRNSWPAGVFGALPLVVITHGQPFPGPLATVERDWGAGQERLAALSTNSRLVVAKNSNHMIQDDEPAVVVDAIRCALDAATQGRSLAD